jgi:hypothetical protein
MEYLMTYGWAILIIAVVLAVLFSLNVFNAGASLGTACIGQPGYSCSAASINQAGMLTFTLGLGTGATAYNVFFSCASSANALSASSLPYNGINSAGTALAGAAAAPAAAGSNTIYNSAQPTIANIQCYPATGGQTTTMLTPIGTSFTGSIWMAYLTSPGTGSFQYVKVATMNVKSSS